MLHMAKGCTLDCSAAIRGVFLHVMIDLLQNLRQRAQGTQVRVVLPEATDPRVLAAAVEAARTDLCQPLLVGSPAAVREAATAAGLELNVPILDPQEDPQLGEMTREFASNLERRKIVVDDVASLVRDPLYYADLLVKSGRAEGAVMGAVATTSQTLRAALRVVGVAPRFKVVTSCFLMVWPEGRTLVYADCGVIPKPTARQLADIAVQAAETYRLLVEGEPRVALLAFSTKGSAKHSTLDPVHGALRHLEELGRETPLGFSFDGELQGDAALVPAVAQRKAPGSSVAGQANVLVFPDLNSGNIAYKLTERLAGARAIGPLLRGLAKPIHDLSRGCSVEDILDTMVITALESQPLTSIASPRRSP
jgi:phosphate acetyltransferase